MAVTVAFGDGPLRGETRTLEEAEAPPMTIVVAGATYALTGGHEMIDGEPVEIYRMAGRRSA